MVKNEPSEDLKGSVGERNDLVEDLGSRVWLRVWGVGFGAEVRGFKV
jgi:hypothetical protein